MHNTPEHFATLSTLLFSYDSSTLQCIHPSKISKVLTLWYLLTIKSHNPFIFVSNFNNHALYFFYFLRLSWKLLDFWAYFQISNLTLTSHLLSCTKIISFAKNIHQEISSWIDLVGSSITCVKRYGFNVDPWCKPYLWYLHLFSC